MTREHFDRIITLIEEEELTLGKACKKVRDEFNVKGISRGAFHCYVCNDKELSSIYARAVRNRTEAMFESLIDIADDSSGDKRTILTKDGREIEVEDTEFVRRSQLRVDTRKWVIAKTLPRKYGDRIFDDEDGPQVPTVSIVIDSTNKNR